MNEMSPKRIGLFGGTFNPIHLGHLRTSLEIREHFRLDEIVYIPAANPPHKETRGMVDAIHRMKMIRLAIADIPGFTTSDIELKRTGPSYTIDTLKHFREISPEGTELYLILGLDAMLEIHTWKSYQAFFRLVPLIVMSRPDPKVPGSGPGWKILEEYLARKISEHYRYSRARKAFTHDEKMAIFKWDVTALDISSSAIRQMIKSGRSPGFLMPEAVIQYIDTEGLYL